MNAPPFPLNPSVGERFGQWVWNGSRWVSSASGGIQIIRQVFNTAGSYPYNPSPGLVSADVEGQGGGGGGGGAQSNLATTAGPGWLMGGGGGASGGYSRIVLPAALVLGGVIVTIGAGGAPGLAGTNGGQGGVTSFGSFLLANGGGGGTLGVAGTHYGVGGEHAQIGVGQFTTNGNGGGGAECLYYDGGFSGGIALGGHGGAGVYGGAGVAQAANVGGGLNGYNGFSGSGAGGGVSGLASLIQSGGTGGDGYVFVTEYCWADVGDDDCCAQPGGATLNVRGRLSLDKGGCGPGPHPHQGQDAFEPYGWSDDDR